MFTAKYILRFDDVCPTMRWSAWNEVVAILTDTGVRPIVAVIPDNGDKFLKFAKANPGFWNHIRTLQERGWTIGLHGYQHVYTTADAGIVGINKYSEFAGLPRRVQELKIINALKIFSREAVRADIWVAPAHSFDATTVTLLKDHGVRRISDGFALFPHIDESGICWIPQQLWRFRRAPIGIWTICCHHNSWAAADIARFKQRLAAYQKDITDVETVVRAFASRQIELTDRLCASVGRVSVLARRSLRNVITVRASGNSTLLS